MLTLSLITLLLISPVPDILVYKIPVTVTAYSPRICETDDSPTITASNKKVKEGYVALSRDIEKKYRLKFGDKVYLEGYGEYQFEDRMHRRKRKQVDIFMHSTKEALKHGRKKSILVIRKKG